MGLNYKSRGLKNKVRGETQGSWRGDDGGLEEKMERQRKGVRHSGKTEGKQEEAAKTVDVVLSSSLCRPVPSNTPKYTITSGRAWETSPNQHTATECLTSLLLLTAEIFIISQASLEGDTLCLRWRQEMTKDWEQSGVFWIRR